MDDKLVNADLILSWIKKQIEEKHPIDAGTWVDACQKLNILRADDDDRLYELQQQVAVLKVAMLEQGKSVAHAKTVVEASDLYRAMLTQKGKISRIEEAIKISKLQARLKDNEYRHS